MQIKPYHSDAQGEWQRFVDNAKNGTFLFQRGYMEYHADRFQDASLMCFEGNTLIACLPATIKGDVVSSHGGLTYGGFITDARMKTERMVVLMQAVCAHYRQQGAKQLIYKPVPHIYHTAPAAEDLYALFRCGAVLQRRHVASARRAGSAVSYSKGRKFCVKKGKENNLKAVEGGNTIDAVMNMVAQYLKVRHDAQPVHSAAEMALLKSRFPGNIRIFTALDAKDEVQAGAVIYETTRVAHCQYLTASDAGREQCALDFLIDYLLKRVYPDKPYFDFGTSMNKDGTLSAGLILNKESYGARAICYDSYQMAL